MYLSRLQITNFRIFGAEADGTNLDLTLRPGLNILVGENDSGKTAIVDAIRHVLWTTSQDYHRLLEDDFHVSAGVKTTSLSIKCVFDGLDETDTARLLEWLSIENDRPLLHVTLAATWLGGGDPGNRGRRDVSVSVKSGADGDGPSIEGTAREFLRVTYLRPLRDAEAALSGGRGSRLSQILNAHPDFGAQKTNDFDKTDPENSRPATLVGVMRQAEHLINQNVVVTQTEDDLNSKYLKPLSIGEDDLKGEIGIAREADLRQVLDKLELWLHPDDAVGTRTPRGLGYNNVLFMATELLLLGGTSKNALPLLLIEEPEAHLHPQLQLRLMEFLESRAVDKDARVQVLLTTHSPNLTSKADLESIVILNRARAFSLSSKLTNLDSSDYRFLRRFLDVTKANVFFAKGVLIVEGDAENIVLPVIANLLGRPFSKYAVSVVNVGSRGLFRYARIFQRKDGLVVPIRVACLADRDVPPDAASSYYETKQTTGVFESQFGKVALQEIEETLKKRDGGAVRTFISPKWTLEHDLARSGLAQDMHIAVQLAKKTKGKAEVPTKAEQEKVVKTATGEFVKFGKDGLTRDQIAAKIYEPLYKKQASKAEAAQFLADRLLDTRKSLAESDVPEYLVDAINYVTCNTAEKPEDTDAA